MIGECLFIGVFKLRYNNKVFNDLPITNISFAGVIAVHLPYKAIVGTARYKMSIDEIYDVKILQDIMHPNILAMDSEFVGGNIVFNNKSFWGQLKEE